MTYNEWRDELKDNLLSVSDTERKRVLDYYAEAYADRREAGFDERRIIEDFGAPYDAAQRILDRGDTADKYAGEMPKCDVSETKIVDAEVVSEGVKSASEPACKKCNIWLVVLAAVVLAVPLFCLGVTLFGIGIGFISVPFAGAVIAVVGLIILLVGLGLNSWTIAADYEMKSYVSTQDVTKLQINFDAGSLKTEFYDGDKILVEYPENNRLKTKIDESVSGVFSMRTDAKFWLLGTGLSKIPETIIKIPKTYCLVLDFCINAGKFDIASGDYADIDVKMNAGTLNFEKIQCAKLNLSLNAGDLKVQDVTCQNAMVKVNAGNVKIAKMLTNTMVVNLNAGNFIINDITAENITADLNAGSVNMDKTCVQKLKLDIDAGSALINVVGEQAEYNIAVQKDGGTCNVSNQSGIDSNKRLDIDIDGGSVKINFV